jgi:hypothetical protein
MEKNNKILALIASIGASGFLLALGYMVDFSRRQLLGFDVRSSESVQGLLFLGASMLVNSFVSGVSWVLEKPYWLALAVLLVSFVVLFRRFLSKRGISWRFRLSLNWLCIVLLLIGLIDIAFLDLPASQLKNLLRRDIRYRPDPAVKEFIRFRGKDLWDSMVCSRMTGTPLRAKLSGYGVTCSKTEGEYRGSLRNYYLVNLIFALSLLTCNAFIIRKYGKRRSRETDPSLIIVALLGGVTFVNTLLLPWTYGKLQETTVVKEAIVRMDNGDNEVLGVHGFILSEGESTVVLFHQVERQPWFIPRDKIYLIRVERHEDVVKAYYGQMLASQRLPPPAEPN